MPGAHERAGDVRPTQGVDAARDLGKPVPHGQAELVQPLQGLVDPHAPSGTLSLEEGLEGNVVRVHAEAQDVQLARTGRFASHVPGQVVGVRC